MRLHSIIVAGLLLAPVPAFAQEATPGAPPAASPPSLSVPVPREEAGVSGYRIIAITAGAVVGVIAANFLTGGMITPILAAGTEPAMAAVGLVEVGAGPGAAAAAAPAAAPAAVAVVEPAAAGAAAPVVETVGYGYMTAQAAVLAAGAVVGGYVGNLVYGK